MNTKQLENCLHIIGYWLNEDEIVIEKMLNSETQIVKQFVKPFSKELNTNLLNKDTIEAKRDLIKYYVFEFWELQGFFKEYNEILFTGSLCNYTPVFYEHTDKSGTVRKLSEFENYVVNGWDLFNMLFNEIQICCFKFKIDFVKVCKELNFSTEYFDSGITIAFEEMGKEYLPSQQTETVTDKLQVNQIALIHVYEGIQITRENAGEIAAKYGYTAKNSGEGLFQDYTNYCSTANRKGKPTPCTPKKLKNKIKLFESVVNHLSDNNKQRAIDEINILKTIFENEYQ